MKWLTGRRVLICGVAISGLISGIEACAQLRTFDVPAGAAVTSIPEFARQAGIQIVAPAGQLANIITPELKGEKDAREALLYLIAGTGLEVASDNNDLVILRARIKAETGSAAELPVLEEVIVSATKRDERLQDVPLSISALGEAKLTAMGADGFLGFYRSVPGLTFNQGDTGRGSFIIRGINTGDGGDNQAPVAVYIDEFPTDDSRGARGLTDLSLFDVQRVEVLRGPQGTLFGSGALGGAVRVITNKPDPTEFAGAAEADVSTFEGGDDSYSLRGMVNVPLFDNKLAMRAVTYYREEGGYVDNLASGKRNVNGSQARGGRLAVKFLAMETLAFTATVVHQQSDDDESGGLDAVIDGQRIRRNSLPNFFNSKMTTYNLVMDWEFDAAKLMSSTTYGNKDTDLRQGIEEGFVGLPLLAGGPDVSRNFAKEVRLTSTGEERLQWTAGAFYFMRKRDALSRLVVPGAGEIFGAPADLLVEADIEMKDSERALYGELTYALSERFKATFGMRWFENTAEYQDRQQGLLVAGEASSGLLKNRDSQTTPKLALAYMPASQSMLYASAAKGYRIGGTNIPNAADPAVPAGYSPDSLWNYEIGAKTSWLANRLSLNAAVYFIDWQDIQIERSSLVNDFAYQDNGGAAHSQGMELEINARPFASLTLSTALSWNCARSDQTIPGTNILDGDRLPGAREFTSAVSVEYTRPVLPDTALFVRADHQYVGKAFADFDNENAPVLEPYHLINLRLGVQRSGWTVTLYADNLLDDDHFASISSSGDIAYRLRPRSIGVNFRTEL